MIHLHGMYDERDGIDNIIADYIQYQTILRNSGAQFIQNLIGTNVQGTNYLAEDCNRLISFFDARSGRPGADNLFEDIKMYWMR